MSGHAGQKGTGVKHSHDTGKLDSAATTPTENPEDLLPEGDGYPFNADETTANPAATQRPEEASADQNQDD